MKIKLNLQSHKYWNLKDKVVSKLLKAKDLQYIGSINFSTPLDIYKKSKRARIYYGVRKQRLSSNKEKIIAHRISAEDLEKRRFQTGVYCRNCKDLIYSTHRRDYRECSCGRSFIDGGTDYVRYDPFGILVTIDLIKGEAEIPEKPKKISLFKRILKKLPFFTILLLFNCGAGDLHVHKYITNETKLTCEKEIIESGINIICSNGFEFFIPNYEKEVEIITLCPDLGSELDFKEVLIRIEGLLYGVYDSPKGEFLTEVRPGDYKTTDGRKCYFTVTDNHQIEY